MAVLSYSMQPEVTTARVAGRRGAGQVRITTASPPILLPDLPVRPVWDCVFRVPVNAPGEFGSIACRPFEELR